MVKKYSSTSTLSSSSWEDSTITIAVEGITTSNTVIVAPSDRDSITAWGESKVMCSSQSTNSLTFTCGDTTPTSDININILIMD